MELRDLYNCKKLLTGKVIKKGDIVPIGYYYITVIVVIENNDHEFLIQKRSIEKGGKWANTGGHPKSGESSLEGIVTEIKEELGIDVKQNELTLFKTIKTDDDFVDLYYLRKDIDINDIVLQKEEVSDVKCANTKEIESLNRLNEFHKEHYKVFKDCIEFLDENIM